MIKLLKWIRGLCQDMLCKLVDIADKIDESIAKRQPQQWRKYDEKLYKLSADEKVVILSEEQGE